MAHPQHNFTSNFNGAEDHNSELTLTINGVEKKYTPAGNDKTYNVPGVARISMDLDGADLVQAIQTALDGAAQPVIVEDQPDGEVIYNYIGESNGTWSFVIATTTSVNQLIIDSTDGSITREQIGFVNGVVIVPSTDVHVYSKLRSAMALGHQPILYVQAAQPVFAMLEALDASDNSTLIFVSGLGTQSTSNRIRYTVYSVASDNMITETIRESSLGKLHRIGVRYVQDGDPSPKPQSDWIIDLESPNPNEPDGYDRLTVSKAIELHENGEIFIFTNFGSATLDSSSCWFYESSVLASSNNITIKLLRSYVSNDVQEVQGANLTSFGNYVGVLDWNSDDEYWRETFVTEGSNSLNHNKIHRLRPATDAVIGETSNYGGWVLDLESPNENVPGGYDRLTPQRLKQILDNGEFLVIETYTGTDYVPLALQALVDVQEENPLRIRVDFVRQYVYSSLLGFEQIAIYTPSGAESYLQMFGIGPNSSWYKDKEALAIDGNGRDVTVSFTEAQTRTNITTGEKLSVLFGKIKKWFTDLKALAFKDKADLTSDVSGVLPIANGGTNASTVADARTNLDVYSKAEVNTAIDTAVASAYHAAGTKTVAQLTNSLLVAANQGNVYNITDSGTTTADFVDGSGHPINAGDNVGVCDVGGGVYKFDLLSGFVDMSVYKTKQTAVTDPTADGNGLTFIDSVSQNANGEITSHKKTVQDGTTSQKGVVQLEDSVSSTATDKAATPNAVKAAYDLASSNSPPLAYYTEQSDDSLRYTSFATFYASWPSGIDTSKDYILDIEVTLQKASSEVNLNNADLPFRCNLMYSTTDYLSEVAGIMTNLRGLAVDYVGNANFLLKMPSAIFSNSLRFMIVFPSGSTSGNTISFECNMRFTEAP